MSLHKSLFVKPITSRSKADLSKYGLTIFCLFISINLLLLTYACQTYVPQPKNPSYTRPDQTIYQNISFERTINKRFDEVWSALIEYSTSTFFAINNFEKASGLLTLNFGSSDPELFIDCGQIQSVTTTYAGSVVGGFQTWDYADLDGVMNIFVKPISTNVTQIKVNARYVFRASDGYNKQVWSFDSGGSDTKMVGGVSQLTCLPTHKAEETILNGIDKIAKGIQN